MWKRTIVSFHWAEDRAVAASRTNKTLQRKVRAPQDRIPGYQGLVRVQRCSRKETALSRLGGNGVRSERVG